MKKLLLKLLLWVLNIMGRMNPKLRKAVHLATNAVQAVKSVLELQNFDMYKEVLKDLIPGPADDIIIDRIHDLALEYIPAIASKLEIIGHTLSTTDPKERIIKVFEMLGYASKEKRQRFLSELATQFTKDMSDDEISWGERAMYVEMYYKAKIQKK